MRFRCLFLLLAVTLVSIPSLASESEREVAGRSFVHEDGRWFQIAASGDRFEVDSQVITVKARESAPAEAIQALHAVLGGTEIRRARTGFVDVRVPTGVAALDLVESYAASPWIEIAEPNTLGRYVFVPNDPS